MVAVAIEEMPTEVLGERAADRRFAGAGRPHQHDHHGATIVARIVAKGPTASEVAPAVYHELRRLAAAYVRRERPGTSLQATALVHEAYLRLAGAGTPWNDRRHFVGIAARSMRQILVERARARGALKRWGALNRVSITDSLQLAADPEMMLPALDEAIERLAQ